MIDAQTWYDFFRVVFYTPKIVKHMAYIANRTHPDNLLLRPYRPDEWALTWPRDNFFSRN
jgi:hypothetical protein